MPKSPKSKNKIKYTIIAVITVMLIIAIKMLYSNMEKVSKSKILEVYKPSLNMQYSSFDSELLSQDKFCRKLRDDENFNDIIQYGLYNDNLASSQSSWNVYADFLNVTKANKKISDSYIIFKNSKAAITQSDILSAYGSGPDVAIDGNNYAFLRDKVFISGGKTTLFYSDMVYHNGQKNQAFIYCEAIDGSQFSLSNAALVSIIPLSSVSDAVRMDKAFGKNIEFVVYSKTKGKVYPATTSYNFNDYTVIDCDDNENFSWGVYIRNDFFRQTTIYYYEMAALFVSYLLICAVVLLLFSKHKQDIATSTLLQYKTSSAIMQGFSVYDHIGRLLYAKPTAEELKWFHTDLPTFPKPCIMAIIKIHGANSVVIRDAFFNLGKCPSFVLPDPDSKFVAFFDYYPNGGGVEEIKSLCAKFIDNLDSQGIRCVISISSPCLDIDEIYQAYMTASLMFKYNEYDNLIVMGETKSKGSYTASDEENNKILKCILSEDSFEANRIIYGQWYQISQNPSFGDEIEKLFVSQVSILATAAVKIEYDKELPKYDSKLSITELAFVVTDAVSDMTLFISQNQNNTTLYNDVISYIDENFTDPEFSQTDIKEKFNISTKIISKILKQRKNMLFSEYLEKLRIEKACYILSHSDIKIYDISKMCGYGTNDAFYKAFNKKMNKTPGAYRKEKLSAKSSQ